jgi:hypothetical protein
MRHLRPELMEYGTPPYSVSGQSMQGECSVTAVAHLFVAAGFSLREPSPVVVHLSQAKACGYGKLRGSSHPKWRYRSNRIRQNAGRRLGFTNPKC